MNSKKRACGLFLILWIVTVLFSSFSASAQGTFAGGSGTQSDPYQISTAAQLNRVRDFPDSHFVLNNDIVFSSGDFAPGGAYYNGGNGWSPIGTWNAPFRGSLDGKGHVIKNLKISYYRAPSNLSESTVLGLFGRISGTVKNLGIEGGSVQVTGSYEYLHAGALAGRTENDLTNCYNAVPVTFTGTCDSVYVGGLVGYAANENKTIRSCYNLGTVSVRSEKPSFEAGFSVGGVTGSSECSMELCYNLGTVTVDASSSYGKASVACGGVTGLISGNTLLNSFNLGSVTVTAQSRDAYTTISLGGVAGSAQAITAFDPVIRNCYNAGALKGTVKAGESQDYVKNHVLRAGGISGYNVMDQQICYNVGSVTGTIPSVAKAENLQIGQLAGYSTSYAKISDCFYFDGKDVGFSDFGATSSAKKLSSAQAKTQNAYTGFDFKSIWLLDSYSPHPYPQLRALPQAALAKITVATPPKSLFCPQGGSLDLTGATLKGTYQLISGKTETATIPMAKEMLSGLDSSKPGKKQVKISYQGCSAELSVTVQCKNHTFGEWTVGTPAGCTTEGSQSALCSVCGTTETKTIAPLGHTYGDFTVIQAPSEGKDGLREWECSVCKEKKQESYTEEQKDDTAPQLPDSDVSSETPSDSGTEPLPEKPKSSAPFWILIGSAAVILTAVGFLVVFLLRNKKSK